MVFCTGVIGAAGLDEELEEEELEDVFLGYPVVGVLPVVGLTLPFFSYGGTSVLTMYIAMGFVSSVRRCTHMEHIMQQDNGG